MRQVDWTVAQPADIQAVAAEWDDLVTRIGGPPFMGASFLLCAIEAFGCERGRLVLGRCNGKLVVGGLVVRCGLGRWVTWQPSQLPLGAWIMEGRLSMESVIVGLCSALPGLALGVSLTQLDPAIAPRPEGHQHLEVLDYVATGWVEIACSFEDFWNARGKNLRQNLPKQRRRLEEQCGAVRFDWLSGAADVDAAFLEFADLESAGWKAAEGTAIAVNSPQGRFYRAMLATYAARGEAFVFRLTVNDKPVAIDFGLRDGNAIVILKTTYDESLKSFSPAQLLHERAFEKIFRERLAGRIEFYGKLMEWHTRWTERSRMLYHVQAYRSPLVRRVGSVARTLRARLMSLRSARVME